ncbi:MAG: hypothetical protein AAGI92_04275 [Pseudomonadota bacterium]
MGRGPISIKPKGKPASGGRGRGAIKGGRGGSRKGGAGGRGRGTAAPNKNVMDKLRGGNVAGGRGGSSSSSASRPPEPYGNVALARGNHFTKPQQKADAPGNYDAPGSPLIGGNAPRNSGNPPGGSSSTSSAPPAAQQPPTNQAMNHQYGPAPAAVNHGQMGGNGAQPIYDAPPVTGPPAGGGGGNNPPPPGGGGGNNNPPPNNNPPGQPFGGMQVQNPPPQRSRASKMLQRIKPESKKGVAAYGMLAALVVGGATAPLWLPAIKEAADDNGSSVPSAEDTRVIGNRTKGVNNPITDIDLVKLVSPAGREAGSEIDPSKFLLFRTFEISEAGAKTINVNGEWTVSNAGKLSFTPDQTSEFGSVTIAYSVEDKLGRLSDRGQVQIVYGPLVDDISINDLAPDKTTAAIAISDVYTAASDAAKSAIDPDSIKLVFRNDITETLTSEVTIDEGGIWRAKDGEITFEPAEGFVSTNINIGFVVSDQEGLRSNEGLITLFFTEKAMVKDPEPGTDPDKPMLAFGPEIAVNTQDVTFAISSVGELKSSSLEISTSPDGTFGTSIDAGSQGTWTVSGNAVTYARGAGFRAAPTTIYYRATSKAGVLSDAFPLTLGIFPPPQALDVTKQGLRAVIDVLPSTQVSYRMENNEIDPSSLRFLAVAPADPSDPTPVVSADGKVAEVADEGTWSVIEKNSKVRFVPVRGFTRQPTAVFYTVRDTKGSESNSAKIVVSKAADDVRKLIADMVALNQEEFASRLKTVLADKPLSDVLVVVFQLRNLFFSQLNEGQRLDIRTAPGISERDQNRIFRAWLDASFAFGVLVDEVESVPEMSLGLQMPRNSLGARVLRLEAMMAALDKYFDALEAAM